MIFRLTVLVMIVAVCLACSGSVGPTGSAGPTGEAGPQGEQGDRGEAGRDGDVGKAGPVGPKGDTGERGEKGDTGNTGLPLILEKVSEGVVGVEGDSRGTGFIFETNANKGLVLTAYHLVDEAESVSVYVEGEVILAEVVEFDSDLDVAVLSICCGRFTDLPWGGLTDDTGWVVSIAHLADGHEFKVGRVRGQKRYSNGTVIFHDTDGRPGYSGAPLLVNGRVVGMTTGESTDQEFEGLVVSLTDETLREVIRSQSR